MINIIVSTFLLLSCSSFELELDITVGRDTMVTDTTQAFYWAKSEGKKCTASCHSIIDHPLGAYEECPMESGRVFIWLNGCRHPLFVNQAD